MARSTRKRLRSLLAIEQSFWSRGVQMVAGVDEVGRGPLAGPVVAAAVVMPPERRINGIDDSKKLTAAQRQKLVEKILGRAWAVGIGAASCREVDRLNIRCASALAMQRALCRLGIAPEHVIVDGLPVPELGDGMHTAVVGGDGSVHAIACASIVAKVCRDRLMARLAGRYPDYAWERNKGYATEEHLDALARFGPTAHHRRSFHGVEQLSFCEELSA